MLNRIRHRARALLWLSCLLILPLLLNGMALATPTLPATAPGAAHCSQHGADPAAPSCCEHSGCDCAGAALALPDMPTPIGTGLPPLPALAARCVTALPALLPAELLRPPIA